MSGRKKSEVTTVLKSAEKTREDIFNARFNELDNIIKKFQEVKSYFNTNESIENETKILEMIKVALKEVNEKIKIFQDKLAKINPQKTDYFDNEYNEAQGYLEKYKTINQNLKEIYNNIDEKISTIFKKNKDAENEALQKFSVLKAMIEDNPYSDPFDPDNKLTLKELAIDRLKLSDLYASIEDLLKTIENNITNKNFIAAIENTNKVTTMLKNLKNECEEKLIKLRERIELTMAIEDALKSIYYEYETTFINDNPTKGIHIRTINSNDINIFIPQESNVENLDVELIINDHSSNCRITADDLAGKLNQMGISFKIKDYGLAQQSDSQKLKMKTEEKSKVSN